MARTRAKQLLDKAGISYELRTYSYDANVERIGVRAAESLGVPTDQVLKTLMAATAGCKFT